MVASMMFDETYELEENEARDSNGSRSRFERSSKARYNTRSRYARGSKGGPTLSGAHRRRGRKSYV